MVNQNKYGLRSLALRSFSQIIDFCRNTPVVTEQIKVTRKGLQRICMTYVKGLSDLYCASTQGEENKSDQDRGQIISDSERN